MLSRLVDEGLASCDMVVMSGGTSKGAGDLCYRAVALFKDPGIVVHGVALKPGKPVCLAVTGGKPVIDPAGIPDLGDLHLPRIRGAGDPRFRGLAAGAGRAGCGDAAAARRLRARPHGVHDGVARTRRDDDTLAAYPIAKGSGAVTAFSQADGFIVVGQHVESVPSGTAVEVQLIGRSHRLADLVIIGSHCVGLDVIAGRLQAEGISVKVLNVGSTGGLAAAKRGECDIAPIHLMDPATGAYNRPLLTSDLELMQGYRRLQGIVFRKGDRRFEGRSAARGHRRRARRCAIASWSTAMPAAARAS